MSNPYISKKVQNYYNDLLNKNAPYGNSNYQHKSFYKEYIEHNILLIFIIVAIVAFLAFRYYHKDDDETYENIKPKKKSLKKEHPEISNDELMSIIDELSTVNEEILISKKQKKMEQERMKEIMLKKQRLREQYEREERKQQQQYYQIENNNMEFMAFNS